MLATKPIVESAEVARLVGDARLPHFIPTSVTARRRRNLQYDPETGRASSSRGLSEGTTHVKDQAIERRLAAILVADVAGYAKLIEADGGGIHRWRETRNEIIEPAVAAETGW